MATERQRSGDRDPEAGGLTVPISEASRSSPEHKHDSHYVDRRGVDRMIQCIVPGCDTGVTRRRGMCSEHWFKLPPELRSAIQQATKANDREKWMAATRRATRLLTGGTSER
jgi:hypothetical protein